jgi:hypothetical protein
VNSERSLVLADEKYYQTAIIKCRDGSKTFSQERLNDDFCDCADGTDEPGKSLRRIFRQLAW